MEGFLDFCNRYIRESDWKDYSLTKICLFSMGLIAGAKLPFRHKKAAVRIAAFSFGATYVFLVGKLLLFALHEVRAQVPGEEAGVGNMGVPDNAAAGGAGVGIGNSAADIYGSDGAPDDGIDSSDFTAD